MLDEDDIILLPEARDQNVRGLGIMGELMELVME